MNKRTFCWTVCLALLFSCADPSKPPVNYGRFSAVIDSKSFSNGGRINGAGDPAFIVLSVEDPVGNKILSTEKLELISFGSSYISESIQLLVGNYQLTEFLILDDSNQVIYATPLTGSPKAAMIQKPLPIPFTIGENSTTQITPEVVEVDPQSTPEQFGYVSFGFIVVSQNDSTVMDIDGNRYPIVRIGGQTWMAENLRTTKYCNGDVIGTTEPLTKNIFTETEPKYEWPYLGNTNSPKYGHFYTWYVATDSRNVCPCNWHVPTADEWTTLFQSLGGLDVAGGKMKEAGTVNWSSPNTGATNSSGFTALAVGARHFYGQPYADGFNTFWWSSTDYSSESGWFSYLSAESGGVYINGMSPTKSMGFSIRCVKD